MAGRDPTQLLDIRLVDEKKIDESFFQDYARIHKLLDDAIAEISPGSGTGECGMRPLPDSEVESVLVPLYAWLFDREKENTPAERLNYFLRCGCGHICAALKAQPGAQAEAVSQAAYEELHARGWDHAVYDSSRGRDSAAIRDRLLKEKEAARAAEAAAAARRTARSAQQGNAKTAAVQPRRTGLNNASDKTTAADYYKVAVKEESTMSNIEESGMKPVAEPAKAKPAKKPAAKKAVKKPAAKKPAAKKTAVKKVAAKKAPAKKAAAKKPAVKKAAAKKPAAKKAVKKAVAKKPAAKKPAAKKAAAKKPAAKKAAAKKAPAKK